MANQNKSNRPTEASRNGNGNNAVKSPATRPLTTPAPPTPGTRRLTPRQEAVRRRAQKRQRTQLIVIGVIIAVIAAAAIIIGISITTPTNFEAIPAQATTDQHPFQLGPDNAKVTVEEYGDYQCPACKYWHDSNQQTFINDYITSNKSVKFVFRVFPFLDANPNEYDSHETGQGAYCASDQNRFWDFHNALYNNQKAEHSNYWTTDRVKDLAKTLKLDTTKFNSCIDTNKYKATVNQALTDGTNRNIHSTPSFFVNGTLVESADYATLQKAVDAALTSSSTTTTPGATTAAGSTTAAAGATPATTPNK